ncbi:MAG: VOC family protein [Actinomycetota bacterium]|nr:VOC family protein [Actinomycetota bacterium]
MANDDRSGFVRLVPELDVANLRTSLDFYVELLGFRVLYERPAERFVYLDLDEAELMLQEAAGPGRRFRTAPLHQPFGRGVNFQLAVRDVDAIYRRVLAAGGRPIVEIEERWYEVEVDLTNGGPMRSQRTEAGNRQFVVADPDGYLWRPYLDLGLRARTDL